MSVSRDSLLLRVLVIVVEIKGSSHHLLLLLNQLLNTTITPRLPPMECHAFPYLKLLPQVCRHRWVPVSVSRDTLLLRRRILVAMVVKVNSNSCLQCLRNICTITTKITLRLSPSPTEFHVFPYLKLEPLVSRYNWVAVSVSRDL